MHPGTSSSRPRVAVQVKSVTGNKILRILKVAGLAPTIPEDLYHLIKKAVPLKSSLSNCK